MWAQYDHLVPHARRGTNELGNLVITCAPCNFGRMEHCLEDVGLIDPRTRETCAFKLGRVGTLPLKYRHSTARLCGRSPGQSCTRTTLGLALTTQIRGSRGRLGTDTRAQLLKSALTPLNQITGEMTILRQLSACSPVSRPNAACVHFLGDNPLHIQVANQISQSPRSNPQKSMPGARGG